VENLRRHERRLESEVDRTGEQLAEVLAELRAVTSRLDALERDRRPS
jgi:hypothetical protein